MKIPFNNLYAQYLSIQNEIDTAIKHVIAESAFISGKFVKKFETEYSAELSMPYCISCGNGTDALFLAMRAFHMTPGDEVITPANSWISSAETITLAGGRVVFCDIDNETYTLDPLSVEKAITPKTKGINSRLDGLQAAILSAKLKHINAWINRRQQLAELYNELLSDIEEISPPKLRAGSSHVFHLYVIRTEKRDALRHQLANADIATGIHYPTALPFLPAYQYLNHSPDDFPVAFMYQNQILSLPIFPEMTEEMVGYVAGQIRQFFTK